MTPFGVGEPGGWLSALPLLVGTGLVLNALRLRHRLSALPRVSPAERAEPLRWAADSREAEGPYGPYAMLTAANAVLSGQARRAALAHAREHDLQVLDLIPADLPVERALDLARHVDPRTYRLDPLALGRGAGFATVVASGLLGRAGVRPGGLEPGEYGAVTVKLRQYAQPCRQGEGYAADLAVVPCHTTPRAPACRGRRAWLGSLGVSPLAALGGSVLSYGLVWLALAADVAWGVLAVAAYCVAPYVTFAGTPLSPRDLHRTALLRLVQTPWNWWRTLYDPLTEWELRQTRLLAKAREGYRDDLAEGLERFFEPRRGDCPWCGARSLATHLVSRDVVQAKPGRFTLDRCEECQHIFQNPQLNEAGLEYYYRDTYDGLGAMTSERLFATQGDSYKARAEMAAAHLSPRMWLDVGAGHGHFCQIARTVMPDTVFDGLDLSQGVREGKQRGWLRRAYRGRFPELVDELAGRYDVVSMFHYLEHTPDPFAELDAAVKILVPGGHLLVELPDPASRSGRLLGRRWGAWMQPQHLHMISMGNLEDALAARGLRVVARERRGAHQRHDLVFSVLTTLTALAPSPSRPWAPPGRTAAARIRRVAGLVLAVPLLAVAAPLDRLVLPLIPGASDAYRVLARKDEG
ncbi:methyltransferase domain-containing protein [Actinomadura sp. 9N407]|uniref:class I SAM-dependent methyltransferase n=1 Tax=Actinomadura sp. 9N407 TaxID=3375154 RepID=UPI00378CB17B